MTEAMSIDVQHVTELNAETETSVVTQAPTAKGRKTRAIPEIDVTQLRRSERATRYNGFKAPSIIEARVVKSKVKPRTVPAAPTVENTTSVADIVRPTPTPTPIPVI